MGYRNYIASISKKEYEKIKNFSREQLYDYKNESLDDGYVGVYNIGEKILYELGKYVEQFPNQFFSPVFENKELQEYYLQEHDLYVVNKEFLAHVIESYSQRVRNYYKKMLDPLINDKEIRYKSEFITSAKKEWNATDGETYTFDPALMNEQEQSSVVNIIHHVKSMASEWGMKSFMDTMRPYDLESDDIVCSSWKYEYAIFELVRIYKTFDWENKIMLYYGY